MIELTEKARRFLTDPNFAALATTNGDGSPQVSAMWVHLDGDYVLMNTALGRYKERNLRRDPRLAITVTDRENPYDKVTIRGRVVEFIEGERAENDIDNLSRKYTGQFPYPWRASGEHRVTMLIEPIGLSEER
jgi:PPOX class probable F420-dependent enzyme